MVYISGNNFHRETGPKPFDVIKGKVPLPPSKVMSATCHFRATVTVGELIKRAQTTDAAGQLYLLELLARKGTKPGARHFALRAIDFLNREGYVNLTSGGSSALKRIPDNIKTAKLGKIPAQSDTNAPYVLPREVLEFVHNDIRQYVDWLFSQHPEYKAVGLDKQEIVNAGLHKFYTRFGNRLKNSKDRPFIDYYAAIRNKIYMVCTRYSEIDYIKEIRQQDLRSQNRQLWDILAAAAVDPNVPEYREAQAAIARDLLATLTTRERCCLERYYYEEETYEVIGDQLGLTGSRIQQIVKEAEKKLRAKVQQESLAETKPSPTTRKKAPRTRNAARPAKATTDIEAPQQVEQLPDLIYPALEPALEHNQEKAPPPTLWQRLAAWLSNLFRKQHE